MWVKYGNTHQYVPDARVRKWVVMRAIGEAVGVEKGRKAKIGGVEHRMKV